MKEERELGKEDDVENGDSGKKKAEKDIKKKKGDKIKESDDSGDDDEKGEIADDVKTSSPGEGSQEENKSRRWWELFKKSE